MPLQLLIEGPNTAAAAADLKARIPSAEEVPEASQSRGLVTIATVIAIFGAVGAGAKMIKDVADMTKSVAELAKLLIEWKQGSAKEEKTILKKETEGGGTEILVLEAETPPEKVEAFLS